MKIGWALLYIFMGFLGLGFSAQNYWVDDNILEEYAIADKYLRDKWGMYPWWNWRRYVYVWGKIREKLVWNLTGGQNER